MADTPPDPATAPGAEDDDPDPVDEWLQFARADLRSARTLWADTEIPPPIPCFHAQQAVEKALKALLTAQGINPPKVHVLGKLYGQLPEKTQAGFDADELAPRPLGGGRALSG